MQNTNYIILGLIFVIWILLAIIAVSTKLVVFEFILPLVSIVFILYLVVTTFIIIKNAWKGM